MTIEVSAEAWYAPDLRSEASILRPASLSATANLLRTVALSLLFAVAHSADGQVVINEIMYHPVEEPGFNASGAPVLDLSEDIHEYVEIYNAGGAAVDISGWRLSEGVDYTFPANTSLPAGGYRLVGRTPARIELVYNLAAASVLGPFTGQLGNNGDTVRLKNAAGNTIDSVSYSARFPWAMSADALGANGDFTGIDPYTLQYKGRSLQRVSTTAGSNDPANWIALPGAAPTPGAANAGARAVPRPVVVSLTVYQSADESRTIRADQPVRIDAAFSSSSPPSAVFVEYFVDEIHSADISVLESYNEPRITTGMTSLGNGQFTVSAPLPGRGDRTIVRYRIKADRGGGIEVVSPRADDPQIVPVNATGREGWHAYFVEPIRTSARPSYDFFVSRGGIATLNTNISQNPRRVQSNGYPRDEPFNGYYPERPQYNPVNYPTSTQPRWNGTVPGVFVHNGVVHDVRTRYHGSRYRRSESENSWKVSFPAYRLLEGEKQRLLLTEKGSETVLGYALFHEAGLPAAYAQFVTFFKNDAGGTQRCEISDNDEETLRRYQEELIAANPQNPPQFNGLGVVYKSKGLDGNEGPYGWAAGQLMPATGVWQILDRYIWSYPIQNSDWVGHTPFHTMLGALWTARGDRSAVGYPNTYTGDPVMNVNIATLRSYLNANWDVDKMLSYLAVRNWCGPWDDKFHNYHVYQQADGKWTMMPWDFDGEIGGQPSSDSIFAGKKDDSGGSYSNNTRGPNWFKDSVLRAFPAEFKQRMFVLNNTLLHPQNVVSIAAAYGTGFNSNWGNERFASVNAQCGLGTFARPAQPTNVAPANNGAAVPPANLQTSTYSHSTAPAPAHTRSKWEIRSADGDYRTAVYSVTSTTGLTSLPIPFSELTFGTTYYWRVTYFDADNHPSVPSVETAFTFGTAPSTRTLVAIDASTQWKYNQTANLDGVNWTAPAYNDASWLSGPAILGVSISTALPPGVRTTLAHGRSTYYFRTHFNFAGSPQGSTLRLRYWADDGLIVYLNGSEVLRTRMNPGGASYVTFANSTVGTAFEEGPVVIPPSALVSGDNVIAVEVHQSTSTSSDLVFGLSLEGTIPAVTGTLVLNEIMADNASTIVNGGTYPDWIEIFNGGNQTEDLGGMTLTDDVLIPSKYVFPPSTLLPAQGYLVVWCDDETTAPGLHSGFRLGNGGQTVALFAPEGGGTMQLRDSLTFGWQIEDASVGRIANGSGSWQLNNPSPGTANVGRETAASASNVRINEWMASPSSGEDWLELHNGDPLPVALGNFYLTDGTTQSRITPLSFLGPKGFIQLFADQQPQNGADHVNFKLSAAGESITLLASNNFTVVNTVTFGAQSAGTSEGRLPDGAPARVFFPATSSPDESNYLPTSVLINEVLTHSDPPREDAIELFNPTNAGIDVGGWFLSDSSGNFKKFQVPAGRTIPAGGYLVFYEGDFNGDPANLNSFSFNSAKGDEAYLSQADTNGSLTGYRTVAKFGAALNGVSFGRYATSNGVDFPALSQTTFGADNAGSVAEFRTGNGAANAAARLSPVIVNEIMYHPAEANAIEPLRYEFIELHNVTDAEVPLYDPAYPANRWRLRDAVSFTFATGSSIPPGSYLLVVSFDPADAAALADFRATYGISAGVPIVGPYTGVLSNSSDSVELVRPDAPQVLPQNYGFVPQILLEKVKYFDNTPWPATADGSGASLQRKGRNTYGNDSIHWEAAPATAGRNNFSQPALGGPDTDGDGMPDSWEAAHGLNPQFAGDGTQDNDGDGQSNHREYLGGTNPQSAQSVFRSEVVKIGNEWVIRFTAQPNLSYSVQKSETLTGATWTSVAQVPAAGTPREVTIVIPSGPEPTRFYRVITPPVP